MAAVVYLLCAVTSLLCAVLLFANYRRARVRLLLWTSLCFTGLALSNVVLFTDMVLTGRDMDLSDFRVMPAVLGFGILVYGFIWDAA